MNLLSSDDLTKDSINKIFEIADKIKDRKEKSTLNGQVLILYFEKPSTRTRLSFESAMAHLGGHAVYIDPSTTQRSRGESLSDTAKMLSAYGNFIAARLYKHEDLIEIAKNSKVPVINALTDMEHPTQALADVYTMRSKKKDLKGSRVAFVGDIATNTANSLMLTASKLGMQVSLIGPKSCTPNTKYLSKARQHSKIMVTDSPEVGLENADFIYTDTFVSMGQEKEAEKRKKMFADYQVDKKMLSLAKKDVHVLHCLPAHRGEEISADVIDGPRSIVWEQAANKMLLNEALLIYLSQRR